MKKIILTMVLLGASLMAENIDALFSKIKAGNAQEQQEFSQRVEKFKQKKNNQTALLSKAKAELASVKNVTQKIQSEFEINNKQLSEKEIILKEKMGNLGEIFGVVRQNAGDLNAIIKGSLVSTQIKGRSQFLEEMSKSKKLPNAKELRKLWMMMLEEIVESGKVVKFKTEVINPDGKKHEAVVTRIGMFTAMVDGKFARFAPENESLVILPRQPQARYLDTAENFPKAVNTESVTIDPTRGAIMELMMEKATFIERIKQGGIVGYVIIGLGVLGLLLAIFKLVSLTTISVKMKKQMKHINKPKKGNPLGRIMTVYNSNDKESVEVVESRLDEAILKELPSITNGEALLKLLAATAPLLGLLGTVVGMIETFQAITLFGTGDPKLMAGGISSALVTTMLGLIVAVPLLFAHSLVRSRSRGILEVITQQSAGLIARRMEKA